MGTTPNPDALEFYTYRYFANNRTFYVGKGHWVTGQKTQRVNDRGIFSSRLGRNLFERGIEHKDCKVSDKRGFLFGAKPARTEAPVRTA
jgi:hypothetical protein